MSFGRIYLITNTSNGKRYIGQTRHPLERRWRAHISASKRPKHTIQYAIAKYGPERFTVEELCVANDKLDLNELEKYYIALAQSVVPNGYNLTYGGETPIFSDESIIRMSESHRGKKLGPYTDNHKRNISAALTGKVTSDETKQKQSAARKGARHSDETKLEMSRTRKGREFSDDHRRKLSEAAKNRAPFTEEHRARIGKSGIGRKLTDEHRLIISAAQKLRHAAKRAAKAA